LKLARESMGASHQFANHAGGVLRVQQFNSRWGSVPEALLEDTRLQLDTRAVAAWLAIKPEGWQISIETLRWRLRESGQHPDPIQDEKLRKKKLGKERWLRIAKELKQAGYLTQSRVRGSKGQWIWNITFTPIPTMVGSADHGSAATG